MDWQVLLGFILYFILVLGIGFYFYQRTEKLSDYLLGGRKLNPYVAAMSAQASDMSGWLLLGLPGSIYLFGIGQAWIGIGLAIGSYLAWLIVARRLRHYTYRAKNSITLSEYFANRFHDKTGILRFLSAVIILVFFTVYVASGFVAAGNILSSIFPEIGYVAAMAVGVVIVVSYTVTGGFKAICWTDFFQALLMIVAIVIVPLAAFGQLGGWSGLEQTLQNTDAGSGFLNFMENANGTSLGIISIISSLAWGLGYFGMPHILVRYMALENPRETKIARRVGTGWIVIALTAAILMAVTGRALYPDLGNANETVFIVMVAGMFAPIVMGILYSALMAAVMSTADSQLLVAASSVTNDLLRMRKKHLSDNRLVWASRAVVIIISIIAALLAIDRNGGIMDLVSYAWAGFGAAFGPVILLSLYWKRANAKGAFAAMLVGFLTVILWNTFLVGGGVIAGGAWCIYDTGLYELLPGFVFATVAMIAVSLATDEPDDEMLRDFDAVATEMKED